MINFQPILENIGYLKPVVFAYHQNWPLGVYRPRNCFTLKSKKGSSPFLVQINILKSFQMSFFYSQIFNLGLLFVFAVILAMVIIGFSFLAGSSNPDFEKVSAYECGFDPYEDARNVFDVRFYLIAILFIVFDLEAVYFFPWSVAYEFLNVDGLWVMFDFIIELVAGFVYA